MATDIAGATVLGKCYLNGNFPTAKTCGKAFDQLRLISAMNTVTNLADTPLITAVDVQEMHVAVPITKACGFGSPLVKGQILIVTTEAETVFGFSESSIELHRRRGDQIRPVAVAVRHMAGLT